MRKLIYSDVGNGFISPSPSPSPASFFNDPAPQHAIFFFPSLPFIDSGYDLATISVVGSVLLLSVLSLAFVLHLRIRSRRWWNLQRFNYLWAVRVLLIAIAAMWAASELLRLPSLRREYLFPFLPTLTLAQQSDLCKVHAVLSLGVFEPGFLVTLLFLINVSVKKRLPRHLWSVVVSIAVTCSPVFILQAIFVFYEPLEAHLPEMMHGSSFLLTDIYGRKTVLCTYPFFSCVIFCGFAVVYSLAFLLSFWKVVELVINKSIRRRINLLVSTLMVVLPLQILGLAVSFMWTPEQSAYCFVVLTVFAAVAWLMVVGEVILVIKPITEALDAGEAIGCGGVVSGQ